MLRVCFYIIIVLCAGVCGNGPGGIAIAGYSSNSSYYISNDVMSCGGGSRTVTNYSLDDTTGQASAAGMSTTTAHTLYAGFWPPVATEEPTPLPTTTPEPTPTGATPTPLPVPATGPIGLGLMLAGFGLLLVTLGIKPRRKTGG